MSDLHYERDLPYERTAVYDVVADIERYPEFVPACRRARILSRDDSRLTVEQEVGLSDWRWRFRTLAHLNRPEWIRIETDEKPFRHFRQLWQFEDRGSDACRLIVDVDYRLRGGLAQRLLSRLFDQALRKSVTAFERRVLKLCG